MTTHDPLAYPPGEDPAPGQTPSVETVEAAEETGLSDKVLPTVDQQDVAAALQVPLNKRLTIQLGAYAWAFIGLAIIMVVLALGISQLSSVIIPLVIALFPAAVLQPITDRLKKGGVPDALAAAVVLLLGFGIVTAVVSFIAPQIAGQFDSLETSVREGYDQVDRFLRGGPFGLDPIRLDDLIDRVTEGLREGGEDGSGGVSNAVAFAGRFFQTATSVLLTLIVVFFYLKDGRLIAGWVRRLFPESVQEDVNIIGQMGWRTVGGYIQGQLIVAVVDAVFIGLGLWILGVDLALPLGVIVFFGGLFPVVGATISGMLAALVALASNGPGTALLVVLVVLGVQALEGNLLQPLILGRALELHPLAIIIALAVGGFLLGILGAFLAVPVAAAGAQAIGYLRKRIPG
jgi:predicted PurR-regulated permease PerM